MQRGQSYSSTHSYLGTRWRSVANTTIRLLYPQERTRDPLNRRLGWTPEAVRTVLEKINSFYLCRRSKAGPSSPYPNYFADSLLYNRNNEVTKNLAYFFQQRLANKLTFNFHDDRHFKLHFLQVVQPCFELFCIAVRRWWTRFSEHRRTAILSLPISAMKICKNMYL